MSSSDEEELLLLLAFQCTSKTRQYWVHPINETREELGEYHRLCRELLSHEDRFFLQHVLLIIMPSVIEKHTLPDFFYKPFSVSHYYRTVTAGNSVFLYNLPFDAAF